MPTSIQTASSAVIVGGSAMLRGTCLSLVTSGWTVAVVGRDRRRLDEMVTAARDASGRLVPIEADYEDAAEYPRVLASELEPLPVARLLVSWVHGGAEAALERTIEVIEGKRAPSRTLLEVRAMSVDGREPPPASRVKLGPGWIRREAVLGFRIDDHGHQRWLTDREIADGLTQVLEADEPHLTLGSAGEWAVKG